MKYTSILIHFFLLFSIGSAPILAQKEIKDITNFRDWNFGETIEEFKQSPVELILLKKKNDKKLYTIKDDDLSVGPVELENIFYEFNSKNQFNKVVLESNVSQNESMEDLLYARLGMHSDQFINDYQTLRFWSLNNVLVTFREQLSGDFRVEIATKLKEDSIDLDSFTDF